MTESELNAKYTVAFVNSLYTDNCGRHVVSKADADRLTNIETGKPIVASKRKLFIEFFGLVNGELIGKKLEVV